MVRVEDKIAFVRREVSEKGKVPFMRISLTYNGKPLHDDMVVGDFAIDKGATLQARFSFSTPSPCLEKLPICPRVPSTDAEDVALNIAVQVQAVELEALFRLNRKLQNKRNLTLRFLYNFRIKLWAQGPTQSLVVGQNIRELSWKQSLLQFKPSMELSPNVRYRVDVLAKGAEPDTLLSWFFTTANIIRGTCCIIDEPSGHIPRQRSGEFRIQLPKLVHTCRDLDPVREKFACISGGFDRSSLLFLHGSRMRSCNDLNAGDTIYSLAVHDLRERLAAVTALSLAAFAMADATPCDATAAAAAVSQARADLEMCQTTLRAAPTRLAVLERDKARQRFAEALRSAAALKDSTTMAVQDVCSRSSVLQLAASSPWLAGGPAEVEIEDVRATAFVAADVATSLESNDDLALARRSMQRLVGGAGAAPVEDFTVAYGLYVTAVGCWRVAGPLVIRARAVAKQAARQCEEDAVKVSKMVLEAADELLGVEGALRDTEQVAIRLAGLEVLLDELEEVALRIRTQQAMLVVSQRAKCRRRLYSEDSSHEQQQANESQTAREELRHADKAVREAIVVLAPAAIDFPEVLHVFGSAMPEEVLPVFRPQRVLDSFYDEVAVDNTGRHRLFHGIGPDGLHMAVKEFVVSSPEAQRVFFREVSILRRLAHPYIVEVRGVFLGLDGPPAYYLEMPVYPGGTLDVWGQRHPGLPLCRALLHVASALEHVHGHRVVHRDVKPENIFVDAEGCARLGDFDVAVSLTERTGSVFTTLAFVGTYGFAAPETLPPSSQHATPASDMFSFGATIAAVGAHAELDGVADLADALRKKDPTARLSATEVRLHSCFSPVHSLALAKPARCRICLEDNFFEIDGIHCAAGHFICNPCLAAHVAADGGRELHIRAAREGRVCCPLAPRECSAAPFSDRDIARVLPADAFGDYMRKREHLVEARLAREAETEMREQLHAEVVRLRAMDERQRRVREAARRIEEEVLVLGCPRCGAAFADFDGCLALRCGRCGCHFCGWCCTGCGDDSDRMHRHVARCPERPKDTVDPLFVPLDAWQVFQRTRRQRKAEFMLQQIEVELREDVRAAISTQLRAL